MAVPCRRPGIRFDVNGLSWDGSPGSRGIGGVLAAVEDVVNASSTHDDRLPPPKVVCFGPGPQSQVMGFRPVVEDGDVELTWMVTSHRLALLAEVPEPAAEEESSRSFWQKAREFGRGEATADPVAQVELEQGQPFGLAAQRDEHVKCQVVPEHGQTREFVPDRPAHSLRSSRLPGPEPAWFSGPAEVRCTGPTTVLLPDRYDKSGLTVLYVLMTASSLMIVVVLVQIARRVRFSNRNARFR
ncbi:hypothetical protein GCM10023108_39160 [Saccharopolyspora hordei]